MKAVQLDGPGPPALNRSNFFTCRRQTRIRSSGLRAVRTSTASSSMVSRQTAFILQTTRATRPASTPNLGKGDVSTREKTGVDCRLRSESNLVIAPAVSIVFDHRSSYHPCTAGLARSVRLR